MMSVRFIHFYCDCDSLFSFNFVKLRSAVYLCFLFSHLLYFYLFYMLSDFNLVKHLVKSLSEWSFIARVNYYHIYFVITFFTVTCIRGFI